MISAGMPQRSAIMSGSDLYACKHGRQGTHAPTSIIMSSTCRAQAPCCSQISWLCHHKTCFDDLQPLLRAAESYTAIASIDGLAISDFSPDMLVDCASNALLIPCSKMINKLPRLIEVKGRYHFDAQALPQLCELFSSALQTPHFSMYIVE